MDNLFSNCLESASTGVGAVRRWDRRRLPDEHRVWQNQNLLPSEGGWRTFYSTQSNATSNSLLYLGLLLKISLITFVTTHPQNNPFPRRFLCSLLELFHTAVFQ